ncbi:asparaginase [Jatrophihabitans fulvus]
MNPDGRTDAGPVLVTVTRGGRVESRHRGSVVLLDPSGPVLELGDPAQPVFARSSLKPLQAAAMLRSGWTPPDDQTLALAAASHEAEPGHVAVARRTLAAAGLTEADLGCPPDLPHHRPAMLALVAAGGTAAAVCHNCSGKHAAMVATCAGVGWPVASYLDAEHPLQVAVRREIEDACGGPIAASTVDGCGAPAHAVPLPALARGFAAIASAPAGSPGQRVYAAVRAHPWLLGGTDRAVSELIAEVPGLLAKDGAEGVWAAALPDGRAMAAKIADGADRALPPVLAAVLRSWGFDGPAVRRWTDVPVLGGGRPQGSISPSDELLAALGLS